jgi:plastocyanin
MLRSVLLMFLLAASHANAAEIVVHLAGAGDQPLPDAVVYAISDKPAPADAKQLRADIDQRNRAFVPLVSIVQRGTSIYFPNSDNIRHQVYSFSPAKVFELRLYSGRPADPVRFDSPGVVVLGCNIHDTMVGWIRVVDTPWFAHANSEGVATLSNVPAGTYSLRAWHPRLSGSEPEIPVEVSGDDKKEMTVHLDAGALRLEQPK